MSDAIRDEIESVFHLVNREIWIVTASAGRRRGGLLATWVSQASIDRERPVVVVGIAPNHNTSELIDAGRSFALHLLLSSQTDLALNFGLGSGRDRDKLANVASSVSAAGSPIIECCLAWLDCQVFARLDSGDRLYYWADVRDARRIQSGTPLTEQQLFAALGDRDKQELAGAMHADIQCQRPLYEAWRRQLPSDLCPDRPAT